MADSIDCGSCSYADCRRPFRGRNPPAERAEADGGSDDYGDAGDYGIADGNAGAYRRANRYTDAGANRYTCSDGYANAGTDRHTDSGANGYADAGTDRHTHADAYTDTGTN